MPGWFRRRQKHRRKFIVRFFPYETLRIATNNFSTLLGRGGYGSVFKGFLPDDGRPVAIKRLHKLDKEGFLENAEFMSHLRHMNIVQLMGCCIENGDHLLVYEYAQFGSLSLQLHCNRNPALNWEIRASICIGTARGLSYLHEEINERVIHRDINPSNILLSANFVPKISDFDLVDVSGRFPIRAQKEEFRVGDADEDNSLSHATSTVKGTMGYLDPDYAVSGKLTEKVDVYSFGLTMLEIITGRRTVDLKQKEEDDRMILNWVTRMKRDGMVLKIVDPMLTDYPKQDVERFINVALMCTQISSELRPTTFEVVMMLYGMHKSNQEISVMAMKAATAGVKWSGCFGIQTSVSMGSSLIMDDSYGRKDGEDGIVSASTSTRIDDKAESQTQGRLVTSKRDLSATTKGGETSCNREGESFTGSDVGMYFQRSMEKIKRGQVTASGQGRRSPNMVVRRGYSEQVSMEAVYPPFLSGEFRLSRFHA